jgi:hypothetical protein
VEKDLLPAVGKENTEVNFTQGDYTHSRTVRECVPAHAQFKVTVQEGTRWTHRKHA